MVKRLIYIILLVVVSCVPYFKNEYGIYQPKKPNYSLKNENDFIFPKNLDTLNLYKYYGYYVNNSIDKDENIKDWFIYNKFCSNGRVYGFGTKKLEEKNLNPNFASKEYYYYDTKNDIIKKESFVTAEGGQYIILQYKLSQNGDTLTSVTNSKRDYVFIREIIPKEWKKYRVDW